MAAFNSKVAFFQNAFKKDTKSPIKIKPKKLKSVNSIWQNKVNKTKKSEPKIPTIHPSLISEDEKIDEYMIWTQYIDKNRIKPSSAFQLSSFTNSNKNNIQSINVFTAKKIFKKYKNSDYKPMVKTNKPIPKKRKYTPLNLQHNAHILFKSTKPTTSQLNELKTIPFLSGICQVCFQNKENILTVSQCQHNLCKDCMRTYIKFAPNKLEIKCPEFNCSSSLDQFLDIKCVLTNEQYGRLYLKKLLNNLSNKLGDQMCLTKTCFNSIPLNEIIGGKLKCYDCSQSWCIHCNSSWHEGIDCNQSYNDQQNVTYDILLNCELKTIGSINDIPSIRSCPNCGEGIEHRSDCKHMYCTKCTTNFCFVCLSLYDSSTGWKCSYPCLVAPRQIIVKSINYIKLFNNT